MRLFVSIDLTDDVRESVAGVQDRFRDAEGLSFVDPEQAHVTLTFLGDTDEDDLPALTDALAATVEDVNFGPFRAEFGGLGVFPSLDYIRVLWLGVREGSEEMTLLHEAVEPRVSDLGFDPEEHEFTPHVTLARMEHAGGKELVQENVRELDPDAGRMEVEEIRLTKSELTSDGPEYSTVEAFEL